MAARQRWFESQAELDPDSLVFIEEAGFPPRRHACALSTENPTLPGRGATRASGLSDHRLIESFRVEAGRASRDSQSGIS